MIELGNLRPVSDQFEANLAKQMNKTKNAYQS